MSVSVIMGNVVGIKNVSRTLSPASVAANTTAEQIFAVPNILATDVVVNVTKPSAQAGLGIVGSRVSSAGNVGITFSNNTAAPIVPTAAEVYQFMVMRCDSVDAGVAF